MRIVTQAELNKTLLDRVDANGGSLEDLRGALALGADPNAVERSGASPIHLAMQIDKARALLEAGANPNALWKGPRSSALPLELALHQTDPDRARLLLEYGADILLVGARPSSDFTPLMLAAFIGDLALVKARGREDDPNALDSSGRGALMFALAGGAPVAVIRELLNLGADPLNAKHSRYGVGVRSGAAFHEQNPLHLAANRAERAPHFAAQLRACAQELSVAQAKILLMSACCSGPEAIAALVESCPEKLPLNAAGYADYDLSPVELAIRIPNAKALRALLGAGFDPNEANPKGLTGLELAASRGEEECCLALLAAGATITQEAIDLGASLKWQGRGERIRAMLSSARAALIERDELAAASARPTLGVKSAKCRI